MPPAERQFRVLAIDDEEPVRILVDRILTAAGYEVVVGADGQEAMRRIEAGEVFDVFVLDVMMPQVHGDELSRLLHRHDPDAKVLFLTGYADHLFKERQMLWENEAFLEKPVSADGLRQAVSMLLFGHLDGPHVDAASKRA